MTPNSIWRLVYKMCPDIRVQTQNDISNLVKVVDGLVEIVTKERNGNKQN